VSKEHVKGLAFVFKLQSGRAKLHCHGTKVNHNFKPLVFYFSMLQFC
jgi:hypothetical protein